MHIKLSCNWCRADAPGQPVDQRLFALLDEIRGGGSIRRAAQAIGVSYRFAWGLIRDWETHFSQALISTERGRKQGAQLTEFGQTLLMEQLETRETLAPLLDEHAARINARLNRVDRGSTRAETRIHASHDLILDTIQDQLRGGINASIDYQVRGSLNNLRSLVKHECDIAGFHFPVTHADTDLVEQYRHYLKTAGASCVELATREQGLIIQKGNPKNIHCISDLTRRSVRFINRQAGSGTRILFDSLLEQENIRPADIRGYVNEEHTHMAIAAMVASHAVDAGMGLKAAARHFRLEFIPLARERYCLALSPQLDKRLRKQLLSVLRAQHSGNKIGKFPGYDTANIGKAVPLAKLFA
ncbi:MAG: LysR family transcriptional regulator [Thiotrichales bacterium]|nr:LysR family transcriptional regulator [Thiotrichales bacterium]